MCQPQAMLRAEYAELKAVHHSNPKLRERDLGVLQRDRVFGRGCFEQARGGSSCSKCSFPNAPGSRVCQTLVRWHEGQPGEMQGVAGPGVG